jgi:DNA-binding MarR family transcriptional regulator
MKDIIHNLNKAFDNRVRLGIMAALMVNDSVDFSSLKDLLSLTDGNLSAHISALEKAGYVSVVKEFVAKKPKTSYSATPEGRTAFKEHIDFLEKLLKDI